MKHPANTNRLASVKDIGLLAGNGNHCDFFVAELRNYSQSNMTQKQIEDFYANATIWNPLNSQTEKIDVSIIANGTIVLVEDKEHFFKRYFPSFWTQSLQNQKLYAVFYDSAGYEAGFDFRCN